jgi:acetyl esterase
MISQYEIVEGVEIQTFSIPSYDGAPIPIRTYVPSNTGSLNPAIFVIHGGGFIVGSLDAEELNCRRFAAELGFSVVNVEHRLAPEHS